MGRGEFSSAGISSFGHLTLILLALLIPTFPAALCHAAPATQPTTAPRDPAVAALIDKLSSGSYRDRQAAQDELVKLGDAARPALQELARSTGNEEVRTAANAALARIDSGEANGPTLITLHVKDADPRTVVPQIAKLADAELSYWPDSMWDPKFNGQVPKATLDEDRQPFWKVLEDFCAQSNCQPAWMGGHEGITLMQGGNRQLSGPKWTSGQFIAIPVAVYRNRTIQFANGPGVSQDNRLTFQLFADPKARILQYDPTVEVVTATDNKGNSLASPSRVFVLGSRLSAARPSWMCDLSAPLNYPANGGDRLVKFKANVHLVIIKKTERLEIPNLTEQTHTKEVVGGWTVEVKNFKRNPSGGELNLVVTRDRASVRPGTFIFDELRGMRIVDDKGETVGSGVGGGGSDTHVDCSMNFNDSRIKSDTPLSLVWDIVTETRPVTVPVEFKDLPLP